MAASNANWQERNRPGEKRCTVCDYWKKLEEFDRHRRGGQGRAATCKACRAAARRKPGERYWDIRKRETTDTHKRCTRCRKWKTLDKFHRQKSGAKGRRAMCAICTDLAKVQYLDNMSPEKKEERRLKNNAYRRRKRAEALERRYESAKWLIKELRRVHGMSYADIFRATGIDNSHLRQIEAGEMKFIHRATAAKLQELFDIRQGIV